jgi:hypothetical protein
MIKSYSKAACHSETSTDLIPDQPLKYLSEFSNEYYVLGKHIINRIISIANRVPKNK